MPGFKPRSSNSRRQNVRAKKPRESACDSRSMRNAPLSGVSVKITLQRWRSRQTAVSPEEVLINLTSPNKILELFETGEAAPVEHFRGHVDALKDIVQLLRTAACIPDATKARQRGFDLIERDPVTAIVRPELTER